LQAFLTANVTGAQGAPNQGSVSFYVGSTFMGVRPVQNGQATFVTPIFAPGTYTFTAVYSGDSQYDISVGSAVAALGQSFPIFTAGINGSKTALVSAASSGSGGVQSGAHSLAVAGTPSGQAPASTASARTQSDNEVSAPTTINRTNGVAALDLTSLTSVRHTTVAIDEALGYWTDGQDGVDYTELAIATLSDADTASERDESTSRRSGRGS
jgi:hypothetical protein